MFKISDRYDLCNSQSSKKDIAGDYDTKVQYILFVMDYLGYSLEKNAIIKNPDEKQEKQQNDFYNSVDNFLNSLGLEIKYDQMKLYRSYYLFKEHKKVPLFALWPNREAEVYLDYVELNEIVPTAYDTSNRIRGNRKSAYKLKTENDIRLLEKLINKIIQ